MNDEFLWDRIAVKNVQNIGSREIFLKIYKDVGGITFNLMKIEDNDAKSRDLVLFTVVDYLVKRYMNKNVISYLNVTCDENLNPIEVVDDCDMIISVIYVDVFSCRVEFEISLKDWISFFL